MIIEINLPAFGSQSVPDGIQMVAAIVSALEGIETHTIRFTANVLSFIVDPKSNLGSTVQSGIMNEPSVVFYLEKPRQLDWHIYLSEAFTEILTILASCSNALGRRSVEVIHAGESLTIPQEETLSWGQFKETFDSIYSVSHYWETLEHP